MKNNLDIRDIVHDGVSAKRAADGMRVGNMANGGLTIFHKKRVASIQAPMTSGARARTIRIHEQLHANRTPLAKSKKFPEIAFQAIEDARVHEVYWPDRMPRRANRDCFATALLDMRTIPPMAALSRADDWNLNLLIALRAMAIVKRLEYATTKRGRHIERLQARVVAAFGPHVARMLDEILNCVNKRKTKALREFTALLREDMPEEQPQRGRNKGKKSDGKQSANPMRIVRLPMHDSCNSAVRRTSLARSGARLNRARLSRAVATGSTVGLFIRRKYLAGGSYCIDASGSMHMSDTRLNEICRAVPAATVAYYSGGMNQRPDGSYGDLVIYAENGKRANHVNYVHGGNAVDLYALLWLLQQPAPRYFVSDGGFCGGPDGQDSQCAALLAAAVASGKVQWLQTIGELETQLGI